MEYTLKDKFSLIKRDIVKFILKNPVAIVKEMMSKDYKHSWTRTPFS